jgi:hypothetical protein
MRPGSLETQIIAGDLVDQKPVGLDMSVAETGPDPFQRMIPELARQQLAG